jgi:hypothetical protein
MKRVFLFILALVIVGKGMQAQERNGKWNQKNINFELLI